MSSSPILFVTTCDFARPLSKRLGGIIGCKDKTSSWHLDRFPDGSKIGLIVSHVGEKLLLLCRFCEYGVLLNTVVNITRFWLGWADTTLMSSIGKGNIYVAIERVSWAVTLMDDSQLKCLNVVAFLLCNRL